MGGALSFNGTNDAVSLGKLGISGNYLTVSAWVKQTQTGQLPHVSNYSGVGMSWRYGIPAPAKAIIFQ